MPPDKETLGASIARLAHEKARYIAPNKEALVEAWVAQHGFKPDESCLVVQDAGDGTTRVWVEHRPTPPAKETAACPERSLWERTIDRLKVASARTGYDHEAEIHNEALDNLVKYVNEARAKAMTTPPAKETAPKQANGGRE